MAHQNHCNTPWFKGRMGKVWVCAGCRQIWFVDRFMGWKMWVELDGEQ